MLERLVGQARLRAPGQELDPVAVVVNQQSVPPESSSHCPSASRQLLYTVSVPPDSSSTLSPGWCVTFQLPILIASARFVGELGGE